MNVLQILRHDWKKLLVFLILPGMLPVIMCWFFSLVFVENIPFGVANLDDSALSRQIVQSFENHPGLDVVYYASSETELQAAIAEKKITGGIIIPGDYGQEIGSQEKSKILMIIDGTNLLVANNALGYASGILGTFNARCLVSVFEAQSVLPSAASQNVTSFSYVERILYDPQLSYMTYLVYIIVPLFIQFFYLNNFLLPLLIKEKAVLLSRQASWKCFASRMAPLAVRIAAMWIAICISSSMGLSLAGRIFGLPVRGNLLAYFVLLMTFLLAITIMGLVLASFLNESNFSYFVEFYLIINMMFVMTSGAIWPEYLLPPGFAAVVKGVWPYILIANPLKFLCLKGSGWELLLPCIARLLYFAAVWMFIAVFIYASKIYRIKRTA